MSEKIYILLPVHNRLEITQRFIKCLKAQTYQKYHLILIDDGSSDGTAEMVQENISSLTVVRGKGNWWWAGALQQGYRWLREQNLSGEDLVLIINDDTEFEADFFDRALALLYQGKRTLLLAQCYSRQTGYLLDVGVTVDWQSFTFKQAKNPNEINCLSTRGLFMRLSDFFETGGFHPMLLPHYASDYEFTIRARRRGMRLFSDASCRLMVDEITTGCLDLYGASPSHSLASLFSRKYAENPFMLSTFIVLSCPLKYMLQNLLKVWVRLSGTVFRILRYWFDRRNIRRGASKSPMQDS